MNYSPHITRLLELQRDIRRNERAIARCLGPNVASKALKRANERVALQLELMRRAA